MERLLTSIKQAGKYSEISKMFEFVNDSRESKPHLEIIEDRRKYLSEVGADAIVDRLAIDEFVVRFLATNEEGVSMFDLAGFIQESDYDHNIDKDLIFREIWNLRDNKVLMVGHDWRLNLAPQFKDELLNENLTS